MLCKKFIVRGKVQGVFFRATTQQEALNLGVRGYAKNLANGDVEIIACGEAPQLEILEQWLWMGPSASAVDDVITSEMTEFDANDYAGFETY